MRSDTPMHLLLLPRRSTSFPRERAASLAPIGFGLVCLLLSISFSVGRAGAQTLLTSECPDGQSVCQVDPRSSSDAAVDTDAVEHEAGAAAGSEVERDAMPLVLTNADLGSTRAALLEREAAEREVRLQRERERARAIERRLATASEAEREGGSGSNTLIPGRGAGGGPEEVWVSMPRDGERVAVGAGEAPDAGPGPEAAHGSETTPSSDPSSEKTQRALADCMERSIRAGNGFVESRRVCEALFPSR